jgi:molybdenum cofactor cytidylyltransferase
VSGLSPIAAVVLAAGFSRRLGRPKQAIVLGGETLVERAVRVAAEAGLSPVIAVIADAGLIDRLKRRGATVLLNRQASEGIASSIRVGVSWAKDLKSSGVLLMTCDQVAVRPQHLRSLCAHPGAPSGSEYAGKAGIPAYFPASSFDALLQLQGDTGARDLLSNARAVPMEDLSFDIDTKEDIGRAQAFFDWPAPESDPNPL